MQSALVHVPEASTSLNPLDKAPVPSDSMLSDYLRLPVREFDDPAEVQRLLQTNLEAHEIMHREGGGAGKVPYMEGWRVIDKAQRIFGFDGWSSKILELRVREVGTPCVACAWQSFQRLLPRARSLGRMLFSS
eukprot:1050581-Pleurochrysis_carterae.AAC.1